MFSNNNVKVPKTRDELLKQLRSDFQNAITLLRQNGVEEKKLYDYSSPIIDWVFSEHPYLIHDKKYGRIEYIDIDADKMTKLIIGLGNLLVKINAQDVANDILNKTLNRELLPSLYHTKYQHHSIFSTKSCAEKLQKFSKELTEQKYRRIYYD